MVTSFWKQTLRPSHSCVYITIGPGWSHMSLLQVHVVMLQQLVCVHQAHKNKIQQNIDKSLVQWFSTLFWPVIAL